MELEVRIVAAGLAVAAMAATHLWFPWLDRRAAGYRHLWVHFAGGIAVGYVTLYLLPKMTDFTLKVIRSEGPQWEVLQYRFYLAFLLGLLAYLMVERSGMRNLRGARTLPWLQGIALGSYNFLMGYFVFGFQRAGIIPYFLAGTVLAVHSAGIDHHLRAFNSYVFDRYLRWILSFSVLLGAALAYVDTLPQGLVYAGSAFLGGAMLVNVMVTELPSSDRGSMKPFLAGVVVMVLVMVLIRSTPYL